MLARTKCILPQFGVRGSLLPASTSTETVVIIITVELIEGRRRSVLLTYRGRGLKQILFIPVDHIPDDDDNEDEQPYNADEEFRCPNGAHTFSRPNNDKGV